MLPLKSLAPSDSKISIGAGDIEPFIADDVILAVPPSVWDQINVDAFPDLERRLAAPPKMGTNVKFLMSFPDRFWRQFASSPTLSEDGPVDLTWETTEDDHPDRGDVVMVAFSGAKDSEECRSWSASARKTNYLDALKNIYPGIAAHLHLHDFIDWPSEKWTKASYYFPRLHDVTNWGPFWKAGFGGWLHFAGEHTSYAFMGYMEGALSSGYRLARRIAIRDRVLPG